MDVLGIVLLAIIAICVILMIRAGKQESDVDSSTAKSGAGVITETTKETVTASPDPALPVHHTIYACGTADGKRLCSCCDGENRLDARTCTVCGRDLT